MEEDERNTALLKCEKEIIEWLIKIHQLSKIYCVAREPEPIVFSEWHTKSMKNAKEILEEFEQLRDETRDRSIRLVTTIVKDYLSKVVKNDEEI